MDQRNAIYLLEAPAYPRRSETRDTPSRRQASLVNGGRYLGGPRRRLGPCMRHVARLRLGLGPRACPTGVT